MGGAEGMSNMGYFTASDDAQITFTIDTMLVNGTYAFDLSTELTNTREWADGLRNIWNGFSDGDTVYTGENAAFRYSKSADTIQLYTGSIRRNRGKCTFAGGFGSADRRGTGYRHYGGAAGCAYGTTADQCQL